MHPLSKPLLLPLCSSQVPEADGSEADKCVVYTVQVRPITLDIVKEARWQDNEEEDTHHYNEEHPLVGMPIPSIKFLSLKK